MSIKISAVLLAGGVGTRVGASLPKQFLLLNKKPIIQYSLEVLLQHPSINEVIVVCQAQYFPFVSDFPIQFAPAGQRRQDSLFNGLQLTTNEWICIHDAARPYVTTDLIDQIIQEGMPFGAATLATPIKNTVKEADANGFVLSTPDRRCIWEVQTPQLIKKEILLKGFERAHLEKLTVTDDVSLAELVHHPVKIIYGSYANIKITTPDDLPSAINKS